MLLKRQPRLLLVPLAVISAAVAFLLLRRTPLPRERHTNVVIILIDALRRDHVGVYGYSRDTTPNIDRFAGESLVFENAISPSYWTCPSIASLFSMLYPTVHGLTGLTPEGYENGTNALDDNLVTFAEILSENGYATGAFVASPCICRDLQFDQGFEVFDPIGSEAKPRADEVNRKAVAWIEDNRDRPFFAYLHYMDVHGPYEPPEPYETHFKSGQARLMSKADVSRLGYLSAGRENDNWDLNYYLDRYDGEIRYLDQEFGQLIEALKRRELFDNSLIVVTSDHGEAFFEHGFCDHGMTLYNEEISIPLIVKLPSTISRTGKAGGYANLLDLSFSILEFLGCQPPYEVDGIDILDHSSETAGNGRRMFSEEMAEKFKGPPKVVMLEGEMKFHYQPHTGEVCEIYNVLNDPGESNNLVDTLRRRAETGREILDRRMRQQMRKRRSLGLEGHSTEIRDSEKYDKLKALGYIQ